MIMGSCTAPFYYVFMCEDSQFYGMIFLGQVYACCLFALYATMRKTEDLSNLWLNAIAYLLAGYSTAPGCLYAGYYMTGD